MLTTKVLWCVLVVIYRFVLSASAFNFSKIVVENNRKIAANVYEEVVADSVVMCAAFCQMSDDCTAANYNTNTSTCSLVYMTYFQTENALGWKYLRLLKAERTFLHITDKVENWDDAKSYCESIGGGLANVNTPSDYEMIKSILDPSQNHRVWLGGSDGVSEGEWIWSNGRRFDDQDFNFWIGGEPNNVSPGQHCLEIYNLEWNDQFCFSLQTFVCEIQVA